MALRSRLVLMLVFGVVLLQAGAGVQEKKKSAVERLVTTSGEQIANAQYELVAARKELISKLVDIVEDRENRVRRAGSVRAAMIVLGEMRAVEGVEVLVDHIGFPYCDQGHGGQGPGDRPGPPFEGGTWYRGPEDIGRVYPAAEALLKIGGPCLDAIVKKSVSPEGVNESVCVAVLGGLRERCLVLERLEELKKEATEEKIVVRLERIIGKLAPKKEK